MTLTRAWELWDRTIAQLCATAGGAYLSTEDRIIAHCELMMAADANRGVPRPVAGRRH